MSEIHVRVITPAGIFREFDTPYLNFQSTDGDRGLLPNHMPLVTSLRIGKMNAEINGAREYFAVSGGLLYFNENRCEVLTDAVENRKDIDIERAKAAKERAEKRLSNAGANVDVARAELALKRALNRLTVAGL